MKDLYEMFWFCMYEIGPQSMYGFSSHIMQLFKDQLEILKNEEEKKPHQLTL